MKLNNIKNKSSKEFIKDWSTFNSTDCIQLTKDLIEIVSKWDFSHRWNYISNLALYRDIFKKYPFIDYGWIKVIKNNKSLCCRNCGSLLRNPYTSKGYCYNCYRSSKERRERISITKLSQSKEEKLKTQRKRIETVFNKYGVYNISNLPEIREKIANSQKGISRPISKSSLDYINEQKYKTKKKNSTFKSSIPEEFSLFILNSIIPCISYYKSNKYPYNCDCYIPDKDLYIEFNYSWTHGSHPFNPDNPEDLIKLEEWKEKSKESLFYKNTIETWTIRDVEKRRVAKSNGLNYLEFFTIKEFLKWLFIFFKEIIDEKFPKVNLNSLEKSYLCYSRSRTKESIPNFYVDNELIVKEDKRLQKNFIKDWTNKEKKKQVILYMLRNKPELFSNTYLPNFAACFFEVNITPKLIEEDFNG